MLWNIRVGSMGRGERTVGAGTIGKHFSDPSEVGHFVAVFFLSWKMYC